MHAKVTLRLAWTRLPMESKFSARKLIPPVSPYDTVFITERTPDHISLSLPLSLTHGDRAAIRGTFYAGIRAVHMNPRGFGFLRPRTCIKE